MSIFDDNNRCIKFSKKRRLIEKFQWLTRSRITKRTDNDTQEDQVGPIEEPPENRVTAIQVDLSDNEVQLLSLGPNYAIAPRVDDNLIRKVKISMASCAYQLRWMKHLKNRSTCSIRAQHLKQQGAPVTKSFVIPPPTNNVDIEDKLKQINNYVLHLYSVVPLNLNHNQAVSLKSLRMKKDSLHISVSDKGGEFVVMEKPVQCELTEHHRTTSGGVYRYLTPTRKYQGNVIQIATLTGVSYSRQTKVAPRKYKRQSAVCGQKFLTEEISARKLNGFS